MKSKKESESLGEALLTEKEMAEYLKMSPRTLQGMRAKSEGPPYIKIGTSVRYKLKTVRKYLEGQAVDPEDDLAI